MNKNLFILGTCIGLVIAAMALRGSPSDSARRAWKDQALTDLSARVENLASISNEVTQLQVRAQKEMDDSGGWISPGLVVMQNGEWLVCTNICRKEDRRISDLFLAYGSDGRWYYSTYHFCIGMVTLRMMDPSDDLTTFVEEYSLRPFDGKSDECLQKTWPPNGLGFSPRNPIRPLPGCVGVRTVQSFQTAIPFSHKGAEHTGGLRFISVNPAAL